MFLSTIKMAIPFKKHNDALKILRSITLQTRDQPGCLGCTIYRDLEDKNVLVLQEKWEAEEHMALHVRSDDYRNLLLVMEMSAREPEVRFDAISGTTGIENIERLRSTISNKKTPDSR